VLVVDDDADTRDLYRLVLESVGYQVAEAGLLLQAVEALRGVPPAAVLTDWLLPDGNGLDVCAAVHARVRGGIPIVAVTGLTVGPDQLAEAQARGCAAVLQKPADPDAVLAALSDALIAATRARLRRIVDRAKRYAGRARLGACDGPQGDRTREQAARVLSRVAARSDVPAALILADDSARYVAAAGETRVLTGYEADELRGLTVADLTPAVDESQARALWDAFLLSGAQEGQFTIQHRDGRKTRVRYSAMANLVPGLHVTALLQTVELSTALVTA
jgi:PAS domain S-box-containing protein